MGKLVQFLTGDYDGVMNNNGGEQQQQPNNTNNNAARLRSLIPVVQEYRRPLSDFGKLLIVRLTEIRIKRSLNWVSEQRTAREKLFQDIGNRLTLLPQP